MHRIAVFVDAGYLFAQGSVAICGTRQARADLTLNAALAVEAIKSVALSCADQCSLLRIYWYDGAIGGSRLTADQALLAHLDNVKVRLGFINSAGQQKGVDSLIVTDLIELARQKAVGDALLLSGDEDVRVGVQIAQNYGVRIHLLGIAPSRANQSIQLMQEADTTREWDAATISTFLSARPVAPTVMATGVTQVTPANTTGTPDPRLDAASRAFVDALQQTDVDGLQAYWRSDRGLPSEMDRRLLPHCRAAIGQDLDQSQKRHVRQEVQRLVRIRIQNPGP